jgi:putative transposase
MLVPQWPNDRWSLDFVIDQFLNARRLRILVVVDDCTRECLALVPTPRSPATERPASSTG